MNNNSFLEMGQELIQAHEVIVLAHINMDADALGSAAALCRAMRQMGKVAYLVVEDELADNLVFMREDYCLSVDEYDKTKHYSSPDMCICVDCSSLDRFPSREHIFNSARTTMCFDHHVTDVPIADYNYIDSKAGATGEIIYDFLKANDFPIDKKIGEYIFASITTDTGNFTYSNTNRHSHEITAELIDLGVDCNDIASTIYENESMEKMMLHSSIIMNAERFAEGRGIISYASQEMFSKFGAVMADTEGVIAKLRSLKNVEIAMMLCEKPDGKLKVSLRSKKGANVMQIAVLFGGGGHKKAAGCTITASLESAIEKLKAAAIEVLEKYDSQDGRN